MAILALLTALAIGSAVVAGWQLCSVTHRQRGLETERVGVPDFIPDNWEHVKAE